MAKLRFGICGLGCMGRGHFARLYQNPRAQITAVCDANEARRCGDWNDELGNIDLVRTRGGRAPLGGMAQYGTPAELIADPNVDAVLITLPTVFHADVAVQALEAGKHVLCEKPMALRPADCDRMIRAAEKAGRCLMVAQCLRFWPQYTLIKELVDGGRLGRVRHVALRRVGSPPTYSAGNWLLKAEQSGGALLDLHVHDIDFAHYLLGVPATIYARGAVGLSGGIDHIVSLYSYEDGRFAVLEGGWWRAPTCPFDMEIMVQGEEGTLHWQSSAGPDVHLHRAGAATEVLTAGGDALAAEQEYFLDAVLNNRSVERCSPQSTRTSVVLAWLERRSAESGIVVRVTDRLRAAWTEEPANAS